MMNAYKIIIFIIYIFAHFQNQIVNCESHSTQWSVNFGNVDLFNVPPLEDFNVFNSEPIKKKLIENSVLHSSDDIVEDAHLKTPQLIKKYGYPIEIHYITTEDGYLLETHRIPRPNSKPVLLNHGLLDSSATWVMMGPNKGLAYYLYDNGFDVWMMNVRGNTYSRNHTKYHTKDAIFWDFTFHEMGKFDIPACIDYILNLTEHKALQYIGHSQGTLTYWVMCSERPDYADKVELMQALAPVAFIKHCKSTLLNFIAFFQDPLKQLLKLIGAHEFMPSNEFIKQFTMKCDEDLWTKEICSNIIFLFTGFDKAQLNESMVPVILGHTPAGASTKQILHYGQLKNSGHLRMYNYGWLRNYWRYDSLEPPEYNLSRVSNKVVIHNAKNDWLAPVEDVRKLAKSLPNLVGQYLVDYDEFNHLDFVWGIDVRSLLYERVLSLMKAHTT